MQNKSLFREEALIAKQSNRLGSIVLIRPISFSVMTLAGAAFAIVILCFMIFGTYTKRNRVSGQLISNLGIVKVYSPQSGVVTEKYVMEGDIIKKGDLLYVLSSDRQNSTKNDIQAAISHQVEDRQRSLKRERAEILKLQVTESDGIRQKISGLEAEMEKLGSQIEGQQNRVGLSRKTYLRYQDLLAQNFISKEQTQQKQEDLLDQENRLKELERSRISINRELQSQVNALAGLPLRQRNQLGEVDRAVAQTEQEFGESEAKRKLAVIAPQGGIATGVVAETGQSVGSTRPLVSIVPAASVMQARLYAPSRTIGFVKAGDSVLLRYEAFPYEKFGHAMGKVVAVSKTALPPDELASVGSMQLSANNEPLYTITVSLAMQTILVNGKPQPLQMGMLLDADIIQETRRIYEWVLEPIYSMTGKL